MAALGPAFGGPTPTGGCGGIIAAPKFGGANAPLPKPKLIRSVFKKFYQICSENKSVQNF